MSKKTTQNRLKLTFNLANAWLLAHIAHKKHKNARKTVASIGTTLLMVLALAIASAFIGQRNAAASDHMGAPKSDHMDEVTLDHMDG